MGLVWAKILVLATTDYTMGLISFKDVEEELGSAVLTVIYNLFVRLKSRKYW